MKDSQLIDLFQKARGDKTLAVIEGVQALKHAVRFQADIENIITCDINNLERLLNKLAPDISQMVLNQAEEVSKVVFNRLSPQPPRTKVIALAKQKRYQLDQIEKNKPIVFLEDPRDLENIGAVIRVSAAANAGAVIISGTADIWHPAVIRGAAGLQYALPCFDHADLNKIKPGRELISLDPTGTDISSQTINKSSILIFGTERHGISKKTLQISDKIVRLPMKDGVSSLNLATSVAATLYQL